MRLTPLGIAIFGVLSAFNGAAEASFNRNVASGQAASGRAPATARPSAVRGGGYKANLQSLKTYSKSSAHSRSVVVGKSVVTYAANRVTIEALLARRALNPARFDAFHPKLGQLLSRDERLRAGGANCGPLNGLISNIPYHKYLLWRRSLDPNRFDRYHPILGAILAEDQRLRALPCPPSGVSPGTTSPGVGAPAGGGSGGGPGGGGPGGGDTPSVPEPSTFVLTLLGSAAILARGMRGRRSTRP